MARVMKSALLQTQKEVAIPAPWGKIAGLSWGDPSNPPVILGHGKMDVASSFRPLISRLPNRFFYLCIEWPGNGKSDHMPKGVRYSIIDLVPTLVKVKDFFKWEKFMYIGHSLAVPIGKHFDIAFPGHITRMVEIDPIPAHHTWPSTREGISTWYHYTYHMYAEDRYHKMNGGLETAPKYTYEKAFDLVLKTRRIPEESVRDILERSLTPTEDGLYRFTYDQRMKEVTVPPFSPENLRQLYTSTKVPTYCFLATEVVNAGVYNKVPFVKDETAWPNKNYKYKIVEGNHDLHIQNPEGIAKEISEFLIEGIGNKSSKL